MINQHKKRDVAIGVTVSLLLHALLFLGANGKGGNNGKDGKGGNPQAIHVIIVDKPAPKKVVDKPKPPTKTKSKVVKKRLLPPPELLIVDHKCEEFYYGVGYQNGGQGGCRVVGVPKGYPADRAGLRVGDLVMNPMGGECPGRGDLGTTLTIVVMRGSQALTLSMVREKICTSKEEK